jgi:hypothetical protein
VNLSLIIFSFFFFSFPFPAACFIGLSFDNGLCLVLGLILCGIFPAPEWKRCGESVGCLAKDDVVILYFNNNNTTCNSTNHCRIVSIWRLLIHMDCIDRVYQALIKSILIYPLEK